MADEQPPDWITTELRHAAATVRAPAHLRLQIDELSRAQSRTRPSRRFILLPAAGLLAAIIIALLLVLPSGTPGGPTVAQAAALGARAVQPQPPTLSPTAEQSQGIFYLGTGVHFPDWKLSGGWTFVGDSINVLDGTKILTIDYAHGSQRLAYSIAETPLLRGQKSGFTSFALGRRTVVSWREADHSCLLSSATVSRATLLTLASSSRVRSSSSN